MKGHASPSTLSRLLEGTLTASEAARVLKHHEKTRHQKDKSDPGADCLQRLFGPVVVIGDDSKVPPA